MPRCILSGGLGIITLLLCCLIGSCRHAGGGSIRYPATWPIPQLTAPPGAVQAKLLDVERITPDEYTLSGVPMNVGGQGQLRKWGLAFTFTGSWDNAYRHVDQCLKPIGFLLSLRKVEDIGFGEVRRLNYVSPDRTMMVVLLFMDGQYSLSVNVFDQPQDPRVPAWVHTTPIP